MNAPPVPSRPFACLPLLALALAACAAVPDAAPAAPPASFPRAGGLSPSRGCTVRVEYQGTAAAHVSWNCSQVSPDVKALRLDVIRPGDAVQDLVSVGRPLPDPWTGTFRDAGVLPGQQTWRIVETQESENEAVLAEVGAAIGTRVAGTPRFDDTVSGTGLEVEVTVPPGIAWTLSDGTTATGGVLVQGRITLPTSGAGLKALLIRLASTHAFSQVEALTLSFEEGSDGSSVSGGKDLALQVRNAQADLRNLQKSTLSVTAGTGGDVTVSESVLDDLNVSVSGTGRAAFTRVEVKPGKDLTLRAQGGTLSFEDGVLPAVTVSSAEGGRATLKGNRIRSSVWLEGRGEVLLERNQMSADPGYAALATNGGARGTLRENVLLNPLKLGLYGAPQVVLERNSFVGDTAIQWTDAEPATPFPVGPNYYGDPGGPTLRKARSAVSLRFLERLGAAIDPPCNDCFDRYFAVDKALPEGAQRDDKGVFPRFWVGGWALGQGSIVHAEPGSSTEIRTGREAMLSLDLLCSDDGVEPRVWAVWDGKVVPPTEAPLLRRDHAAQEPQARTLGKATVDFILPPLAEGGMKQLEVFLDATAVSGYDAEPPPVWKCLSTQVRVKAFSATRTLDVAVIPVQLVVPGYSASTPSAGSVEKAVRQMIPAMTGVAASEMLVGTTPTWVSPGVLAAFSRNLLVVGLTGQLQSAMALQQMALGYVPHLAVGVTAPGSLPGGASTMCSQGTVALVGANRGDGVLHEIGHLAGMNCGPGELYLIDPPHGTALTRLTAFNTEGNGFMTSDGDSGRIVHRLHPDSPEWSAKDPWLAVMGDNATSLFWPQAPEAGTLTAWLTGLYGWWPSGGVPSPGTSLPGAAGGWSEARPAPSQAAQRASGDPQKRIFAWGMLSSTGSGESLRWRLVPGTLRAVEVPGAFGDPSGLGTWGEQEPVERYRLRATSPTGAVGLDEEFTVRPRRGGSDLSAAAPAWWASFDVPEWVDAWRIERLSDGEVIFEVPAAAGPSVALASPAPGSALEGTFQVRWEGADPLAAEPEGAVAFHQPVQHRVQFSRDGGASWIEAPGTVEGRSAIFDAGFLKGSGTVSLRVVASDGARTAQDRVDGLRAPDRPPAVAIRWPAEGTRAATGTAWRLQAEATDPEGEALAPGTWTSDRDGVLGTGEVLRGVVLSAGDHRLSYAVQDAAGQPGSAAVAVSVGDLSAFDATLSPDALAVLPPGREAYSDEPPTLVPGASHAAVLRFRAPGAPWSGTLALSLQGPGGAEEPLAEASVALAPFETWALAAEFVPSAEGDHRFRGRVTAASPADPQAGNDVREWVHSTRAPAFLAADPPILDAGAALPGGAGASASLALRNDGGRDLALGTLALEEPGPFALESDGCSGMVLAGGAACAVTVRFTPEAAGAFEGTLSVPSDDPRGSPARVSLRGLGASRFRLAVFLPSAAAGAVSSEPAGIACPPDCLAAFDPGTDVVLRAVPGAGASFAGWEPGPCFGAGDCTLRMDGDRTVGARFAGPGTGGPDGLGPDASGTDASGPADAGSELPEGVEADGPGGGGGKSGGCSAGALPGGGAALALLAVLGALARRRRKGGGAG